MAATRKQRRVSAPRIPREIAMACLMAAAVVFWTLVLLVYWFF
jgi:hypothetical protein